MEAEFIGERDNQGNPVPNETMTMQDWNEKNFLAAGKLPQFLCLPPTLFSAGNEDAI